jgi:predicted dehydrogenase
VGDAATVSLAPLRVVTERAGVPVDVTPAGFGQQTGLEGWQESIEAEVADVVDAVREGRLPLVRVADAVTVQAIVDALYRSADTRHEVAIDLPVGGDRQGGDES